MILADNYLALNAEMIGAWMAVMAKSGFSIATSYPPARPGGQPPAIILQSGNRFNFSCSTSGIAEKWFKAFFCSLSGACHSFYVPLPYIMYLIYPCPISNSPTFFSWAGQKVHMRYISDFPSTVCPAQWSRTPRKICENRNLSTIKTQCQCQLSCINIRWRFTVKMEDI